MTGGIMLIGVWLMLQHQCCAVNQNEKSRNSFLIDQLSRRSSLEKNFMRFGRSPSEGEQKGSQARPARGADFMRFGRPSEVTGVVGKREIQERSGSNDFMRFGRSPNVGDKSRNKNSDAGFMRFGRFIESSFNKGKEEVKTRLEDLGINEENHGRQGQSGILPFGWADILETDAVGNMETGEDKAGMVGQSDFFRLGRSLVLQSGQLGNLEGNEEKRGRQGQTGFMRFGKSGVLETESLGDLNMGGEKRGKQDRQTGFIRFGRSGVPEKLGRQGQSGFIRFGRSGEFETGPLGDLYVGSGKRGKQGQTSFIRFGRAGVLGSGDLARRKEEDFLRFGKASTPPIQPFFPQPPQPYILALPQSGFNKNNGKYVFRTG